MALYMAVWVVARSRLGDETGGGNNLSQHSGGVGEGDLGDWPVVYTSGWSWKGDCGCGRGLFRITKESGVAETRWSGLESKVRFSVVL